TMRLQCKSIRARTIFSLALLAAALAPLTSAQAWTLKEVHRFCSNRFCADGYLPLARPYLAPSGNIYGTALFTRTYHDLPGSVEQLSSDSTTLKCKLHTLYQFCKDGPPCSEGASPIRSVIAHTAGNRYGTASDANAQNGGFVSELSPGTHPH